LAILCSYTCKFVLQFLELFYHIIGIRKNESTFNSFISAQSVISVQILDKN